MLRPLAPLSGLLAAAALAACFVDPGLEATTEGSSGGSAGSTGAMMTTTGATTTTAGESTSGTGVASSTSGGETSGSSSDGSTSAPPAVCGNGVVEAPEACDDGPANAAHGLGVCRPTCALPACGDGSLYLGALGPAIEVAIVDGPYTIGDDTRRAMHVEEDGEAGVVWEQGNASGGPPGRPPAGGRVGGVSTTTAASSPAVAIGGHGLGRTAVAWEAMKGADRDVRIRRFSTQEVSDAADALAHPPSVSLQGSPTVAYDDQAATLVAYVEQPAANTTQHVLFRRIPPGEIAAAPPPVTLSSHATGEANPPVIASGGGAVAVAWGDPGGSIVYRRVEGGVPAGSVVSSSLRPTSGGPPVSSRRWSAAAMSGAGSLVVVGVTEAATVGLQRFDAADAAGPVVAVSDGAAAFVPYLDVAADAHGNLVVAWTECGAAGEMLSSCAGIPSRMWIRWYYSDLTPVGPAVAVLATAIPPSPVGVDMRADGRTALVGRDGAKIFLRRAALECPP